MEFILSCFLNIGFINFLIFLLKMKFEILGIDYPSSGAHFTLFQKKIHPESTDNESAIYNLPTRVGLWGPFRNITQKCDGHSVLDISLILTHTSFSFYSWLQKNSFKLVLISLKKYLNSKIAQFY